VEVLRVLERATTRDDDRCTGQFGAFRLCDFGADEGGEASVAGRNDCLDRAAAAFTLGLGEHRTANGDDLLCIRRLDGRDGVTGIGRTRERVRAIDREDFADRHDV